MAEPQLDPPDVYADQFTVFFSAYGVMLNLNASSATPPGVGSPAQAERVVTVRMSLELAKHMAYLLQKQVRQFEREAGITIGLPLQVLNQTGIGPEDWESFWKASQ